MPHAEIKHSSDLHIDARALLKTIEATIAARDPGAGACKGRAYPTDVFHHTHILIHVSMLPKAHRDNDWTTAMLAELEQAVKAHIMEPCAFSLMVEFSPQSYVTHAYTP